MFIHKDDEKRCDQIDWIIDSVTQNCTHSVSLGTYCFLESVLLRESNSY